MNSTFVNGIVAYGDRYRREMLGAYERQELSRNWWSALDFFFGRACYQGRRDHISEKVQKAVVDVLSPLFCGENSAANYREERRQGWNTVRSRLSDRIGKGKVGKGRDVDMVLSSLDFIAQLPSMNIVNYSVERIQNGEIGKHHSELQHSRNRNGIVQVGPKIASFYLRDVVSLYRLETNVTEQFAFCLQPVDVWVRKLAHKTGIVDEATKDDKKIQEAIVTLCRKHGCSPLQFNQGAWYAGYFAFDLLLEMLQK